MCLICWYCHILFNVILAAVLWAWLCCNIQFYSQSNPLPVFPEERPPMGQVVGQAGSQTSFLLDVFINIWKVKVGANWEWLRTQFRLLLVFEMGGSLCPGKGKCFVVCLIWCLGLEQSVVLKCPRRQHQLRPGFRIDFWWVTAYCLFSSNPIFVCLELAAKYKFETSPSLSAHKGAS